MNEKERYLFDLQGYLVVKNVLNQEQLTAMNRAIEERQSKGEQVTTGFFEWQEPTFRGLISDPVIKPYLLEILGTHYRLDHEYAIVHQRGSSQLNLHGGGTPYDPGQYYHVRNEHMYSGLTVVSYALTDIGPDDGGFCCIPGSHKSNYRLPAEYRHYDEIGPTIHVEQNAGDVLIFTEALTHGTFAWQGTHERRSLLLKYTPSMISWAEHNRSPELLSLLNDEEKHILSSPRNSY